MSEGATERVCVECGYDLAGCAPPRLCPECGVPEPRPMSEESATDLSRIVGALWWICLGTGSLAVWVIVASLGRPLGLLLWFLFLALSALSVTLVANACLALQASLAAPGPRLKKLLARVRLVAWLARLGVWIGPLLALSFGIHITHLRKAVRISGPGRVEAPVFEVIANLGSVASAVLTIYLMVLVGRLAILPCYRLMLPVRRASQTGQLAFRMVAFGLPLSGLVIAILVVLDTRVGADAAVRIGVWLHSLVLATALGGPLLLISNLYRSIALAAAGVLNAKKSPASSGQGPSQPAARAEGDR